jgi:hypothetical protein
MSLTEDPNKSGIIAQELSEDPGSMNEDRGWGVIVSMKVEVADALVHGPQFTIVIDLVGWEINDSDSTKFGEYFQIAEVELSDKEHARWVP